jgi:hypothetical protein
VAPAELFPTSITPITDVVNFVQSIGQGVNDALTAEGLPSLPNLPILTTLTNDLLNSPLAAPISLAPPEVTLAVPPQLADAIDGPLNDLNALLNTVINDEVDPAIQSTVYGIGDSLRAALTSDGAPAQITNAVYVLEQIGPIGLETPAAFLTLTKVCVSKVT